MANLNNYGTITGNLVRDPKVLEKKDGSKKVFVTIAAKDNFRSGADKTYGTQFVRLQGYVKAGSELGVYSFMKKGAPWTLGYSVRTNNYVDAAGEKHYGQVLFIENAETRETKAAADAREAAAKSREAAKYRKEGIPF